MRYARVQGILEQEAAFVAKMGSRTEAVFKPTGEKQLFSPEVIAVTQAIHNAGKDAHKVHKTEIIKFAIKVFGIGQPAAAVNGASVALPADPAPATAPATPAAASKPAKATSKSSGKQKEHTQATKPPEPPAKEEPPKSITAAPNAEGENRDAALQKAKETLNPERPGENQAAFNAYISMYSMTLTLLQLVELYDNQPGHEKRFKTLDDLAKEFNKYTSIKSAKEAQKAQS
jgi:hypothetical protein